MAPSRPELELGVAGRFEPHQQGLVVSVATAVETGHDLGVAAIEPLCQSYQRAEDLDGSPQLARQLCVLVVRLGRRRLPVIPRDQGHDLDFLGIEAAQVAVLDQIQRVLVMTLVADVDADIVQQRGVLEPLAFPRAQAVELARRIE